jgi:hypothetical protein
MPIKNSISGLLLVVLLAQIGLSHQFSVERTDENQTTSNEVAHVFGQHRLSFHQDQARNPSQHGLVIILTPKRLP